MKIYGAFLKKEMMEQIRTYKFLLIMIIFVIFGITNPLIAKLTPELMSSLMTEGIEINMPDPTAMDAWTQFFKNISQIGFLVLLLVYSSILSNETGKGTLIPILTKGLRRHVVIITKYAVMAGVWTLSMLMSFLLTWGYTEYLFSDSMVNSLLPAVLCLWIFGLFLLASLLFAAVITNSSYTCLLLVGMEVVICMVINVFPKAYKYNPISLASKNMDILAESTGVSELYPGLIITALLSVLFIVLAVGLFRKKQI